MTSDSIRKVSPSREEAKETRESIKYTARWVISTRLSSCLFPLMFTRFILQQLCWQRGHRSLRWNVYYFSQVLMRPYQNILLLWSMCNLLLASCEMLKRMFFLEWVFFNHLIRPIPMPLNIYCKIYNNFVGISGQGLCVESACSPCDCNSFIYLFAAELSTLFTFFNFAFIICLLTLQLPDIPVSRSSWGSSGLNSSSLS